MGIGTGDLPGWITTFIALGGVLFGARNLSALTRERKQAQANAIYFRYEFPTPGNALDSTRLHVMNLSDTPITSLIISAYNYPQLSWVDHISRPLLKMGDDWVVELRHPEGPDFDLVVTLLQFTDGMNRSWTKLDNGKMYSFDCQPGLIDRLRYFHSNRYIRLRTWRMTPEDRLDWLKHHAFIGGLLAWGYKGTYARKWF